MNKKSTIDKKPHWVAERSFFGQRFASIFTRQQEAITLAALWELQGYRVRVLPLSQYIGKA